MAIQLLQQFRETKIKLTTRTHVHISVYIASGLWLFTIRSHYVFECGIEFAISTEHVDRTHQNLIQMAIFLRVNELKKKIKIDTINRLIQQRRTIK